MNPQQEADFFARFERDLGLRNAGHRVPTRPLGRPSTKSGQQDASRRRRLRQQWLSLRWLILPALLVAVLSLTVVSLMQDPLIPQDENEHERLRREEFRLLPNLNTTGLSCQYSNLQYYIEKSKQQRNPFPIPGPELEHLAGELKRLSMFEDRLHASLQSIAQQRNEALQKLRRYQSAIDGSGQAWVSWRLWRHVGPLWALSKTFEAARSEARRDHDSLSNDLRAVLVPFDRAVDNFCRPIHQTYSYELYGQNPTLRLEERRALELAQGLCLIAEAGLRGWRECNGGRGRLELTRPYCAGAFPRGSAFDTLEHLLDELDAGANDARSAASCGIVCSCFIGLHCMLY
ncbi:hypothetical protein EV127DRAFT_404848 [Xylaria flabelliformis]|nr:hypothetical protein EV127DRAFT_404848 [Xylaria flabelliformis]